jgi:hypothetical protein
MRRNFRLRTIGLAILTLLAIPVLILYADGLEERFNVKRLRGAGVDAAYLRLESQIQEYYRKNGRLPDRLTDVAAVSGGEEFSDLDQRVKFSYRRDDGCYEVWIGGDGGIESADSSRRVCGF